MKRTARVLTATTTMILLASGAAVALAVALLVISGFGRQTAVAQTAPPGTLDANCPEPHDYPAAVGRVAQTFTTANSGKLTGAKVLVSNKGGAGEDFVIEVASVDGSGVPAQPVLASTSVAGSAVPDYPARTTITANFADPATVEAGRQYSLIVRRETSDFTAYYRESNPCPGGDAYSSGRNWSFPWNLNTGFDSVPDDLVFGVYVLSDEFNGHKYRLTSGAKSWAEAEAGAASLGGHLVAINDAAEQQFLIDTFLTGSDANKAYWIGLTDQDSEGTFEWTTGEPVSYTNWHSGEPNEFVSGEDYAAMNWHHAADNNLQKGTWNDTPVSGTSDAGAPYFGIVEIEPPTASVKPSEGRTGVRRNANVTATFSKAMDRDTLVTDPAAHTSTTFRLFKGGSTSTQQVPAKVTVSKDGKTATLDPSSRLGKRKTYTARIVGAKDSSGNVLPDKVWSFKAGRK